MKKSFKKFILIAGLLGAVLPAHAMTYIDAKLLEAIEQDCKGSFEEQSYLRKIENYLEKGANVNTRAQNQETPIMRVVNIFGRDGEAVCESSRSVKKYLMYCGGSLIALPFLIVLLIERDFWNRQGWWENGIFHVVNASPLKKFRNGFALAACCTTLLYGAYSLGRFVVSDYPNIARFNNMSAKFQVLKMLLMHPSIDLSAKNAQGKTVYNLVRDYVEKSKVLYADSSCFGLYTRQYVRLMNEVDALLAVPAVLKKY